MTAQQLQILSEYGVDVRGAIHRMCDDSSLYETYLGIFLRDTTIDKLNQAVQSRDWDTAFTAVHALKGVAGNMGFVPLMYTVSRLVVQIRSAKTDELDGAMAIVNRSYREAMNVIQDYFAIAEEGECS